MEGRESWRRRKEGGREAHLWIRGVTCERVPLELVVVRVERGEELLSQFAIAELDQWVNLS